MIHKYFEKKGQRNFSIAVVWINGGSNLDVEGKKGLNQMLCSLLSRGCKGFENLEISEYIDSHGAELNLETLEDGILISLKSLDEHFFNLYPLLDLIINKPLLQKRQFKNVKISTINSLKKDKENPFNIAFEKWRKLVYVKHPYAYNSSGYEKDILKITHNDILSEYENFKKREKYLISNNLKIKTTSTELFNQNITKVKSDYKYAESNNLKRFVSTYKKSNQIILMLGNQTCPQSNFDYLPLKVLESHLSYGMSSALFKLFREKNGLTYDVGVFNPFRNQNSPFLIYLSVSNKNAILAFEILCELWQNLLCSLISEREIYLAKTKLKSSFLVSKQSSEEVLQRRIQLIGYGLEPDFDINCLKKIEDIHSGEILKITNKYLTKPYISIYGNEKICNEIEKLWIDNF